MLRSFYLRWRCKRYLRYYGLGYRLSTADRMRLREGVARKLPELRPSMFRYSDYWLCCKYLDLET